MQTSPTINTYLEAIVTAGVMAARSIARSVTQGSPPIRLMRFFQLVLVFAFLLVSAPIRAQLTNPTTAGSTGQMMGGIGTVLQEGTTLFANPAGIGFVEEDQVLLQAENRFLIGELNAIQAGVILSGPTNHWGLRLRHFGPQEYNEQEAALVYARALGAGFSLGIGAHLRQQRIPEFGTRRIITASLGIQMNLLPELTLGAMLFNPVRQEVTPGEYLPAFLAVGVRYQPSPQVAVFAEVEKDIDFEARFKAGIRYYLGEVLTLRTGIRTQPTQFSFGLGVPVGDNLIIDVGAWQHQQLGISPLFNLSYQW